MKRTFTQTLNLLCNAALEFQKRDGRPNVLRLAEAMGMNQSTLKRMLDKDYKEDPKGDSVEKIIKFFGITRDQLVGATPIPWLDVTDGNRHIPQSVSGPVQILGWIPLITYAQAGKSKTESFTRDFTAIDRVRPTTADCSKSTFALKVEGDSMTLPDGVRGHSFPHGIIIYVDPESAPQPDHYVVARSISDNAVNFRRMILDEGRPVLVALNPDKHAYPTIRESFEIIGRVIDATWGGL